MRQRGRSEAAHYVEYHPVQQENVNQNFDTTLEVLHYIIAHPYRANFKDLLFPDFIVKRLHGMRNLTVFHLANLLSLMGLDEQIVHLKSILENKDSQKSPEEKLQEFLDHLYQLFNALSVDPNLAEHVGSLKKLKKLIHQFARDNDLDRRLFNLDKLEQKLKEQLANAIQAAEAVEQEKINQKLAEVARLRLHYSNRQYAYISDPKFEPVTSEEREERIKAKSRLNITSLVVSVIVAIGEGMVAAIFAAAAWPLWLAIVAVGIPGAICNYYLFRRDSFDILKDIYFGRIWKKPDGTSLTRTEKGFVVFSLAFSFGAGAAFGFLSFGSGIAGFTAICAMIGLVANPIGIMVLATVVALVTTVALFTIFAYMTVNWVRNGGPEKLKQTILNFPSEFIKFWKHEQWSQLTLGQKAGHILYKIIEGTFKLTFAALAVFAVIAVNVATAGQFKHLSSNILQGVMGFGKAVSNIVSYVLIVGLGGVVNSLFYGRNVINVLNLFKDIIVGTVTGVVNFCKNPKQVLCQMKEHLTSMSPIRFFNNIVTFFKRAVLFSCVGMNAYGQGNGVRYDPVALNWVHGITRLNTTVVSNINMMTLASGSAGGNGMAAAKATALPPVVSKPVRDNLPAPSRGYRGVRVFEMPRPAAQQDRNPQEVQQQRPVAEPGA